MFSDDDDDEGGAWLLDESTPPANASMSVEEIAGDAELAASLAMEDLNLNPTHTTVSARATFGTDFHHRGQRLYDALVCTVSSLQHSTTL